MTESEIARRMAASARDAGKPRDGDPASAAFVEHCDKERAAKRENLLRQGGVPVEVARDKSPLDLAVDGLHLGIAELENRVSMLWARLEPVIRTGPEPCQGLSEPEPSEQKRVSPAVEYIQAAGTRLSQQLSSLSELLRRLEV